MLRNVCAKCGKVLPGEPVTQKEYPDAILLLRDEVVVMYDDLCASCEHKLRRAVSNFTNDVTSAPPVETPAPVEQVEEPAPAPAEAEGGQKSEEAAEPQPAPCQPVDKDALPNQVTKQFPVKLPTRPS